MTSKGVRVMISTQPERQTRTVGLAMKAALARAEAHENCKLRQQGLCKRSCEGCLPQ